MAQIDVAPAGEHEHEVTVDDGRSVAHPRHHVTGAERAARSAFQEEGLTPSQWSNAAGFRYARHQHPYHKVLYCVAGSITFHTDDGDVPLAPGDRLDLPPGTPHAATVGDAGVTCLEAPRG